MVNVIGMMPCEKCSHHSLEFSSSLFLGVNVLLFLYNLLLSITMLQTYSNCMDYATTIILALVLTTLCLYCSLHWMLSAKTIMKLQQANAELSKLAFLDDLTLLPNRRALHNHLDSLIQNHQRTSSEFLLLFIDIDDFKQINDKFGHDTGDRLLHQVAHRLARNTNFVARLAGDEFIVTMTDWSVDDVCKAVNQLIEELARPFRLIDDLIIQISVSVGISTFPHDGTDLLSLIGQADATMYVAKQQGKNRFCFRTAKRRDPQSNALQPGNLLLNV